MLKPAVVLGFNFLISWLVLATGRLQSTVVGQVGFLLLLWAVSVALLIVKTRTAVVVSSVVLFAVDAFAVRTVFSPLTVWLTENRDVHDARAVLRLISSEQDQYWLEHKRYSSSVDGLTSSFGSLGINSKIVLKKVTSMEWEAVTHVGTAVCAWGKSRRTLVNDGISLEPTCVASGKPKTSILSDRFSLRSHSPIRQSADSSYNDALVFPQHRFDESHQATVPGGVKGYTWNVRLAPEIRASPSVGYNTVFVGSHGSGELTAISLETGQVKWGVRVPNWIHHEPIVADDKLFVGFGNNQPNANTPTLRRLASLGWGSIGSSPSGIQVIDAYSGKFLWRQYTSSSMMASPLIYKHLVIAREYEGVVHAWDLRTGKPVWSVALPPPAVGPMTNPLLVKDVVIVASDPGSWCVISAQNGSLLRCQRVAGVFFGPGHSSPAAKDSVLVYHGVRSSLETDLARIALFDRFFSRRYSDVFIEAVNWRSGAVLWRRTISGSRVSLSPGHIAGTPVIAGRMVVLVLPVIGEVVSLDLSSGTVVWRKAVLPARGSPAVYGNKVLTMTTKPSFVVLDLSSGKQLCEAAMPLRADRAGLTIVGATGIAAFLNGEVLAAPIRDWFECTLSREAVSG